MESPNIEPVVIEPTFDVSTIKDVEPLDPEEFDRLNQVYGITFSEP